MLEHVRAGDGCGIPLSFPKGRLAPGDIPGAIRLGAGLEGVSEYPLHHGFVRLDGRQGQQRLGQR